MNRKLIFLLSMISLMFGAVFAQAKAIKGVPGNAGGRWAICIGINDYQDKRIVDLKNARNDAMVMADALKSGGQFDEVLVMTDEKAPESPDYPKKNSIQDKMNYLKGKVKAEDMVVFFFSGHGISNAGGEGFLVLANSYRENLNGSSLMVKEVVKWLNEMGVHKSFLILNANQESFLQDGSQIKGAVMENFAADQQGGVFYAGSANQSGVDDAGGKTGVFASFLADGVNGFADRRDKGGNGDGLVTFNELAQFVRGGVAQWSSRRGKSLTPDIKFFSPAYGNLVISAGSVTAAELAKGLSSTAVAASGASAGLRSQPMDLPAKEAAAAAKRLGFFDKVMNPSGDCRNNFQAKTVNGDKVVEDDAHRLMWHPAGSELAMELSKAKEWLAAFNSRKYAGYDDWRLPTLEEALTLLENAPKNGALYIDPLFSSAVKNMWTCDVLGAEIGWFASFDSGKMNRDYVFNYVFVRPVRSVK